VPALGHLDDHLGSRLPRITRVAAEPAADLAMLTARPLARSPTACITSSHTSGARSSILGALSGMVKAHAIISDMPCSFGFWIDCSPRTYATPTRSFVGRVGLEPTTKGL
jgi:hypothetical protein